MGNAGSPGQGGDARARPGVEESRCAALLSAHSCILSIRRKPRRPYCGQPTDLGG
jgi:hypothetical protein